MNLHRERNGHQKLHAKITDIIISIILHARERDLEYSLSLANRRELYPKSVEKQQKTLFRCLGRQTKQYFD